VQVSDTCVQRAALSVSLEPQSVQGIETKEWKRNAERSPYTMQDCSLDSAVDQNGRSCSPSKVGGEGSLRVGTPLRLKGHKGHATPTAPTLMRVVKISNQQPGYPAGSCVSRHRILKSRCQPLPHVQPYPNEGFSIKLRPFAICHLPSALHNIPGPRASSSAPPPGTFLYLYEVLVSPSRGVRELLSFSFCRLMVLAPTKPHSAGQLQASVTHARLEVLPVRCVD